MASRKRGGASSSRKQVIPSDTSSSEEDTDFDEVPGPPGEDLDESSEAEPEEAEADEAESNGDESNGDESNGDESNGDESNGDESNGDESNGDESDEDEPDEDEPDEDEPDEDEPDEGEPDEAEPDEGEPDSQQESTLATRDQSGGTDHPQGSGPPGASSSSASGSGIQRRPYPVMKPPVYSPHIEGESDAHGFSVDLTTVAINASLQDSAAMAQSQGDAPSTQQETGLPSANLPELAEVRLQQAILDSCEEYKMCLVQGHNQPEDDDDHDPNSDTVEAKKARLDKNSPDHPSSSSGDKVGEKTEPIVESPASPEDEVGEKTEPVVESPASPEDEVGEKTEPVVESPDSPSPSSDEKKDEDSDHVPENSNQGKGAQS